MPKILAVLMMALSGCYALALGALQCFAPERLKRVYTLFSSSGNARASAGHSTIQWLRDRQTSPSFFNRASGLLLMLLGTTILIFSIASLFHGR